MKMCKSSRNATYIILLTALAMIACESRQADGPENDTAATAPAIITVEDFESAHVDARRVDVWLPPQYDQSDRDFPVLYMQDGQNLFTNENNPFGSGEWGVDETMGRLIESGEIEPTIVVGIWNTEKRFREYQPEAPFAAYAPELQETLKEMFDGGPLSDNYLKFIVEELKPFIDDTYRTRPGQEDTFIMGSSMGGLISIYALVRYPDVFGGAACLSTHWPVALEDIEETGIGIVDYLGEVLPAAGKHRVYFDYGTEYIDAWYEKHQLRMNDNMRESGFTEGEDWVTLKFEGAGHNEIEWNKRLHLPLQHLLAPDE